MKTSKIPVVVLGVLCLGFVGFLAWSAPHLPEQVATHFGRRGLPDNWMHRSAAVWMIGALGIGLPLFMAAVSRVIRLVPVNLVNIPHREYWLAPERRESTYAFVGRRLTWLACLMVCFMAAMHAITIAANNANPVQLPMGAFWALLAGFFMVIGLWVGSLIWRFKLPADAP